MKNLLPYLSALLLSNIGYTQEMLDLPKSGKSLEFTSNHGILSTLWNLKDTPAEPYYFNFYDGVKPVIILKLIKTIEGVILEPIETNGKNVLIEFWKNDEVVYQYLETNKKIKGPIFRLDQIKQQISSRVVATKLIHPEQQQIWPVLLPFALCCINFESTRENNPPRRKIKILWNCHCLSGLGDSRSLSLKVGNQTIETDYITYSIDTNINDTISTKMIVSK